MSLSGCQALHGCELKESCLRYITYINNTPYQGFNAHQLCRLSHFTEKRYLHFIPFEEFKDEPRAVTVQRANSG